MAIVHYAIDDDRLCVSAFIYAPSELQVVGMALFDSPCLLVDRSLLVAVRHH